MPPRSSVVKRFEQPSPSALSARPSFRAKSYCIRICDLELKARIGLYEHERTSPQALRLSLTLEAAPPQGTFQGTEDIVCYKTLVGGIEALIKQGHVDLLEQLADKIAAFCLSMPQARAVRLRLEKPEAIAQTEHCGIDVHYHRHDM